MAKREDNLIPFTSEQNREEAKKNGRKGGIASGKARREKAIMKATLEMLLEEKTKNGKTYKELATLGLIKGAIKGNAQNYRTILEVLGELKENHNENEVNNQIMNIANLLNNPQPNRSDEDVQ